MMILLFMLLWSFTQGVFALYERVSQPAISLERSSCWLCVHVSVFPNQRSALSGLAVGFVFVYLCFQSVISLERSSCWLCVHVSVFPNQRSALSGLAVGFVFVYLCFQSVISLEQSSCWLCIHVSVFPTSNQP